MRTPACVGALGLVLASACGGPDRRNLEISRDCLCVQVDGGVLTTITVSSGPGLFCSVTTDEAASRCQALEVPTAGCIRIGACTCVLGRDLPDYCR